MGRYFIGDDSDFKDLAKMVPMRGVLQVENNEIRGVIRERQGKYHFEAMEFVREVGSKNMMADVVVFSAVTSQQGELEQVSIKKGAWVTTPSPHLAGQVVRERILRPILNLMQNSGSEN